MLVSGVHQSDLFISIVYIYVCVCVCIYIYTHTHTFIHIYTYTYMGFLCGSMVKNPPASAGDEGSISRLGRSPGEEMAAHSSILAWKIP